MVSMFCVTQHVFVGKIIENPVSLLFLSPEGQDGICWRPFGWSQLTVRISGYNPSLQGVKVGTWTSSHITPRSQWEINASILGAQLVLSTLYLVQGPKPRNSTTCFQANFTTTKAIKTIPHRPANRPVRCTYNLFETHFPNSSTLCPVVK